MIARGVMHAGVTILARSRWDGGLRRSVRTMSRVPYVAPLMVRAGGSGHHFSSLLGKTGKPGVGLTGPPGASSTVTGPVGRVGQPEVIESAPIVVVRKKEGTEKAPAGTADVRCGRTTPDGVPHLLTGWTNLGGGTLVHEGLVNTQSSPPARPYEEIAWYAEVANESTEKAIEIGGGALCVGK